MKYFNIKSRSWVEATNGLSRKLINTALQYYKTTSVAFFFSQFIRKQNILVNQGHPSKLISSS